jgi:predicted component of type VI protein secretion system
VTYRYEESFEVEDFSTNGTYLNGKRMVKQEKKRLKSGDELGIVVMQPGERLVLGYVFWDAQ